MFKLLLKIFLWLVVVGVVLILAVCGILWYWSNPAPTAPGDLLSSAPQLRSVFSGLKKDGDIVIFPLAQLQIDGLVLARKDYTQGPESRLSPMDVVLGWAPVSAPGVAAKVAVTQADRSYRLKTNASGLDEATILRNTANLHLIPDSPQVKSMLAAIAPGDFVSMKGNLVGVGDASGWQWIPSMGKADASLLGMDILLVKSVEKFTVNAGKPQRPGDGPPASGVYTLQTPVKVTLAHGEMTLPVGAVIEIARREGDKTKGRYNGLEFVVLTKNLR